MYKSWFAVFIRLAVYAKINHKSPRLAVSRKA